MPKKNFMIRCSTLSVQAISTLFLAGSMLMLGGNEAWAGSCKPVHGQFINQVLIPPGTTCLSQFACVSGQAKGVLKGDFLSTITSFAPSIDTAVTGVFFVTADLVLHTKNGDLLLKEAAASNQNPDEGDLGDVVTVVGGTGQWTGATGRLRVWGNLSTTISDVTYDGEVCVP